MFGYTAGEIIGHGVVSIAALTAQAFTEQVEECGKVGMDGHLAKPFDPDTLLAAVVLAAATRRARGEGSGPASLSVAVPIVPCMIGLDLLVLEPRTFERTASFLASGTVASYLRAIAACGEAIYAICASQKPSRTCDGASIKLYHEISHNGSASGVPTSILAENYTLLRFRPSERRRRDR